MSRSGGRWLSPRLGTKAASSSPGPPHPKAHTCLSHPHHGSFLMDANSVQFPRQCPQPHVLMLSHNHHGRARLWGDGISPSSGCSSEELRPTCLSKGTPCTSISRRHRETHHMISDCHDQKVRQSQL